MLDANIYNYIRYIDRLTIYTIKKDIGINNYHQINDLAKITAYSSDDKKIGPILIIKGIFKEEPIYLISIGGTEIGRNQQNGISADILSAMELNNSYLKTVNKVIKENIPKKSNIFIIGSSLGGMIAQQVVSNKEIKENYNIVTVLTFGSPIINPNIRTCRVRRMCDKSDIVTKLSLSTLFNNNKELDELEKCVEDGGYKNFIEAHKYSYIYSEVWNKYDIFGIVDGKNFITLDMDTIKYYDALN